MGIEYKGGIMMKKNDKMTNMWIRALKKCNIKTPLLLDKPMKFFVAMQKYEVKLESEFQLG